jgi:hypothetical protein
MAGHYQNGQTQLISIRYYYLVFTSISLEIIKSMGRRYSFMQVYVEACLLKKSFVVHVAK